MKTFPSCLVISPSLSIAGLTASEVTNQSPGQAPIENPTTHAEADYQLGKRLFLGDGMERDLVEAAALMRSAAESGHAGAQGYYGFLLSKGSGLPKDENAAVTWLNRRAAEQGNAKARARLGRLLAGGLVGKRDVVEAYYWLWKSAEQEEWNAINFLKDMVHGMTEEERKEALKRIGVEAEGK
jgi:hypothetical protein